MKSVLRKVISLYLCVILTGIIIGFVGLLSRGILHFFQNILWYQVNPVTAAINTTMDKTEWSPTFSHSSFQKIEKGWNSKKVEELLGQPLLITQSNNDTFWHYTTGPNGLALSGSDGSTHVRFIVFDDKMKVMSKHIYFYLD